jgi:hypothetical protein
MQPNTKPQPEPQDKKHTPIDQLVEEVRTDAAKDPEAYARETVVPEGGE